MRLNYSALSDVGRVRRDNQDSGYAGPWLLTVCDGVGGAARGDIASSTAIAQLIRLDSKPGDDVLGAIAGAIHRAHDRIAELVDEDASLNGTSTTVTLAVFTGDKLALGHLGDSRAYLYRDGTISQLTTDHTFVQTLIDEGRITEEESRVHPHRNLILKALDAVHDTEPDLFEVELAVGDRILVCSDGASGVLDNDRLADILRTGTPDFAAVELVRASLEAGSSDNVTCVVAEVVDDAADLTDLQPLLVGAAAELPRRKGAFTPAGRSGSIFRGHRSGDTGELEPIPADLPFAIANDPIDAEEHRYALRPPARFGGLKALLRVAVLVGLLWIGGAAAWNWSQQQYFIGEQDGHVAVYRGVNGTVVGLELSHVYETTDLSLDNLSSYDAGLVREGIDVESLDEAHHTITNLAARQKCSTPGGSC